MSAEPICKECGAPAPSSVQGRQRLYCSDECMFRFNRRRYRRRLPPLAVKTEKNCAHCGKAFIAKSRDRIYCYDGYCRQKAHVAGRPAAYGFTRTFTCDGCGSEFEATRPARWCSKLCANRHWGNVRARQRPNPSKADYTDLEIFERDRWKCHICGKQVRRDVPRTHPQGATIDHLTPISKGGEDVSTNVATAHWDCNRDKRAGSANDQLRLV